MKRPETIPWELEVADETVGHVQLSGRFLQCSRKEAVVCVHGLGGSVESGYMAQLLEAAARADRSCLLLNCRGADRSGADVYHSGLVTDLAAALNSPELNGMDHIDLFGYSVGGHIALRYAVGPVDARVRRVAAIGSPLDLRAAADDFDRSSFNVYRSNVMDSLKEIYTAAYQRRPEGLSPIEARKITKIRQWDEQIIAPRFGFRSADHYYQEASVGPCLSELSVQGIYVGATHDPMILKSSVEPHLRSDNLTAVWQEKAGHLGFSKGFSLNQPGDLGLEHQVLSWLSQGSVS